jgi:hypothetical protein
VYRHLDLDRIAATLERLQGRIRERFPSSNLALVAAELLSVAGQTRERAERIQRPNWGLRSLIALAIGLLLLLVIGAVWFSWRLGPGPARLPDLLQAVDAVVNEIILIGAAIYFLVSLERRIKRRHTLRALHELRSIAHVIDAHQLMKDPEQFLRPRERVSADPPPEREMTRFELSRYLDYCSEMLSLTAKLAAVYAQCHDDPVVLTAVTYVESLAANLSNKIWQKMTILDTIVLQREKAVVEEGGGGR